MKKLLLAAVTALIAFSPASALEIKKGMTVPVYNTLLCDDGYARTIMDTLQSNYEEGGKLSLELQSTPNGRVDAAGKMEPVCSYLHGVGQFIVLDIYETVYTIKTPTGESFRSVVIKVGYKSATGEKRTGELIMPAKFVGPDSFGA